MQLTRSFCIVFLGSITLLGSLALAQTTQGPPPQQGVPNYQSLTDEELCKADPTFSTACTEEQRQAYEREWNRRLQNMTPAERQRMLGMREAERSRYLDESQGQAKATGDYYRRDFPAEQEAKELGPPPQAPMAAPGAPSRTTPR